MADDGARPRPSPLRTIGPGLAGLFSLALVASLPVIPLLGVFLALLAPLPLVHLVATGKPSFLAWGWVAAVLAGGALVVRQPWLAAACFGYLVIAALPAMSVEAWLRRGWSTGRWLALGSMATLVAVTAYVSAAFYPASPVEALTRWFEQASAGAEGLALMLAGSTTAAKETVESALRLAATLLPALVTMFIQASMLWLRPRLAVLGLLRGEEPFASYASEEWLPIGFAIGGLGWVFAGGVTQWLAANVFVVVLALYFLHGLAIVHYYLGPRLARNRWVRVLLVIFALQLPIAVLFSALGLADSFFRLRKGQPLSGGTNE
jgi:uncharacterized protein YybS (DUF2232 family)